MPVEICRIDCEWKVWGNEVVGTIPLEGGSPAASAQFLLGASDCVERAAGGDSGFHRRRWELWGVGSLANGELG